MPKKNNQNKLNKTSPRGAKCFNCQKSFLVKYNSAIGMPSQKKLLALLNWPPLKLPS